MVHPGGRPRTVSPDPNQCIELGEQMIKWVKENNPSHLSEWYSIEMFIPWKTWNAMCEVPEFLPYYEVALNMIAKNIRNESIDKSLGQRFLGLYHRDLKQYDMDMKKFEAELDANKAESVPEAVVNSNNAVLEQLKEIRRDQSSARNRESNKRSEE